MWGEHAKGKTTGKLLSSARAAKKDRRVTGGGDLRVKRPPPPLPRTPPRTTGVTSTAKRPPRRARRFARPMSASDSRWSLPREHARLSEHPTLWFDQSRGFRAHVPPSPPRAPAPCRVSPPFDTPDRGRVNPAVRPRGERGETRPRHRTGDELFSGDRAVLPGRTSSPIDRGPRAASQKRRAGTPTCIATL